MIAIFFSLVIVFILISLVIPVKQIRSVTVANTLSNSVAALHRPGSWRSLDSGRNTHINEAGFMLWTISEPAHGGNSTEKVIARIIAITRLDHDSITLMAGINIDKSIPGDEVCHFRELPSTLGLVVGRFEGRFGQRIGLYAAMEKFISDLGPIEIAPGQKIRTSVPIQICLRKCKNGRPLHLVRQRLRLEMSVPIVDQCRRCQ